MRALSALLGLLLIGCAHRGAPALVPAAMQPKSAVEVIVHVERVPVRLPASKFVCPDNPPIPFMPSAKARDTYEAALMDAADQCRANLEALEPGGAP